MESIHPSIERARGLALCGGDDHGQPLSSHYQVIIIIRPDQNQILVFFQTLFLNSLEKGS